MRKIILTLSGIFFPMLIFCQIITPFQKKFGTLEDESISALKALSETEFMAAGGVLTNDTNVQARLHKIDLNGNVLSTWELGQEELDIIYDFEVFGDGSLIALIYTYPHSSGTFNSYVCKINQDGTRDWELQFGDEIDNVRGDELMKTSEGNLLVSGYYKPEDGNGKGILIKLTPIGSIIFRKYWDASSDFDCFDDVVEVDDGYIVTGYSNFADPSSSVVVPIVAKFDYSGSLIWSNAYDDGFQVPPAGFEVLKGEGGNIYVAYGSRGINSNYYSEQDIIAMKLDKNGSVLWAKRYSNATGPEFIDQLQFSHEGHLLVLGNLLGLGFDKENGFVMRIDQEGNLLQVNLFGKNGGDYIYDLVPIIDNGCQGYLLAGATNSFSIGDDRDCWILKTGDNFGAFDDCFTSGIESQFNVSNVSVQISSLGTVGNWNITSTPNITLETGINLTSTTIPECGTEPVACVVSTQSLPDDVELALFPNPTSGYVNVEGETSAIHSYRLYNVLGKLISISPFDQAGIDLSGIPAGIYMIGFWDQNNRQLAVRKVVKE